MKYVNLFCSLVISLDTFYEDNNNSVHILLSGSDDKTVKQLHVYPEIMDNKEVKNLPVFDTFWDKTGLHVAIANNKKKIHVQNGRNVLTETKELPSRVKHITFAPCGQKVAYSLENGNVEEFDLISLRHVPVMMLQDTVTYLKYYNLKSEDVKFGEPANLLVAASENGTLMVSKSGKCICLRKPLNPKQVPIKPIVQSFYVKCVQRLLTVSKNRSIMLWDFDKVTSAVLQGDKNSTVTSAALSGDESMLAVTMADGSFDVFTLHVENGGLRAEFVQGKCLNGGLRSCAFSCDKKYLALGKEDGNIEVSGKSLLILLITLQGVFLFVL